MKSPCGVELERNDAIVRVRSRRDGRMRTQWRDYAEERRRVGKLRRWHVGRLRSHTGWLWWRAGRSCGCGGVQAASTGTRRWHAKQQARGHGCGGVLGRGRGAASKGTERQARAQIRCSARRRHSGLRRGRLGYGLWQTAAADRTRSKTYG
jgi:hypothetical protein